MKLDFSEVVIESNAAGEPLSVKVPFRVFQQMTVIIDAARLHEANRNGDVKPGMYRSSLSRYAADEPESEKGELASNRKPAFFVPGYQTGPKPASSKNQKRAELESLFYGAAPIADDPAPDLTPADRLRELPLANAGASIEVEIPPLPDKPAVIPNEPAERAPFARVRLARGLSREEVAQKYGCTAATLGVYESPGFHMTEGVLERLASIYEVKPKEVRAAYARWRKNS